MHFISVTLNIQLFVTIDLTTVASNANKILEDTYAKIAHSIPNKNEKYTLLD